MRHRFYIAVAALALLVAEPVAAQDDPSPSTLSVAGRGVAERAPDTFFIGAELIGRGTDQVSALRALAEIQARVSDGLNRLDGLTGGTLRTEEVSVEPVVSRECADQYRSDRSSCVPAAFTATMDIQFKGAPVSMSGDAVSLASELGAQRASATGQEVEDEAALRAQAARLAFVDARLQAEALAAASGRRLGRIIRIEDPAARPVERQSDSVQDIVVTGSRMRPSVAIPVEHPPVQVEAHVNVVFELE